MPEFEIYFAPHTCARVPMVILEEIGVPYTPHLVRFLRDEHKSPEYRRLNPKSKVPTLLIDGEALSENVAIIRHLSTVFPDAGVLPKVASPLEHDRQIADLCFCSSTLHPIVTRIRLPFFFAHADVSRQVWTVACEAMRPCFQVVEDRLGEHQWWYGDTWSAMDAYLNWVFWRVEGAEFDVSEFPRFTAHARRMEQRDSVRKVRALEEEAVRTLEAEGLNFVIPPLPEE